MPLARPWKITALALGSAAALLCAAAAWWLPSNEELALRAAQAATEALGVQVTVGALDWHVLPTPRVVVRDVATNQQRPLRLERLTVAPRLLPLLSGRIELASVVLDGATVEQRSLRGLGGGAAKPERQGSAPPLELSRVEFRDLTWVSRSGVPVVYAGEADFERGLALRTATLRRPGLTPAADLVVTRETDGAEAGTQRFTLRVRLAGGHADGQAQVRTAADGQLRLQGMLAPRGIEVQAALAAFNRRSPLAGQAEGETRFSADGANPLQLVQRLHTETRFTIRPATALRFDLDRAIATLGREHQGQTRLDQLRGRVETQNSPDGTVFRFLDIQASAGKFSASGDARLQDQRLQARAAVDLVDGVVGLPMTIEGPMGQLKVTVSKAPLVGAAVGTAVLPGVGTAIGAAIGRVLGGDGPPAAAPRRP
ncbi:hypothetical protein [Pseudorhodoferax sp. Leaf267]|uniref:hypothetical protein n=1 Tax=Pseudorhodoferax sp. Leaf267 TaxID=1736316 RepID=UPI0006F2BF26|nr:hypothetical protein [Pseudorhodoferax sp. Leaf267]KQP11962.1 hypothetical protein ASF43_23760 [Pseudorhodoferax sp. Leaf267]